MKTLVLATALGVTLTACSSAGTKTGGLQKIAAAQLKATIAKRQGKSTPPKALTRADVANIKVPLVQVSVASSGFKEVGKLVATNNGYQNFYTGSNKSFVMRKGQLTATRGLRFDMLSRDMGTAPRTYRYLSALNGVEQLTVTCETVERKKDSVKILDYTYNLTVTEEVCRNGFTAFKNRIWRDGNGKPRKAQQWIGPRAGFAVIEWLN